MELTSGLTAVGKQFFSGFGAALCAAQGRFGDQVGAHR
jgi:hypothetical protein